jgi:Thoeris protein ThsB, TIR-like domain
MARKVFFSFHYKPDSPRAAQVRNIGAVAGNTPVSDNDWEKVKGGGDAAIKKWIAGQLSGKSCAVVLAGANTAGRKWITHEIVEAWNAKKGVVCIYVNKLKSLDGKQAAKGKNPLADVTVGGKKLSEIARTYTPSGTTSKEVYDWISKHLSNAVEEAIKIRAMN